MTSIKKCIHQIILDNWENFPWKLDYIFHLLYSNNGEISDIMFQCEADVFILKCFRVDGELIQNSNCNELIITKDELFNFLNINSAYFDFAYSTQIFTNKYFFRGHKIVTSKGDMLTFRFLNTGNEINFNAFNTILDNYYLSYELNEKLPINNEIIAKKIKV